MLKITDNENELYDTVPKEQCCDNPDIFESECEVVCRNCGCVVAKRYENSLRRIYTQEDTKNRKTNEPVTNRYHYRTTFKPYENVQLNSSENDVNIPRRTKYNRLLKIQISYSDNFSRNMVLINPIFKQVKNILNIPDHIIEQAKRYYCIAIKRSIIKGRSVKSFVFASLLISIRQMLFPITYDQILNTYFECLDVTNYNRDTIPKISSNIEETQEDDEKSLDKKNIKKSRYNTYRRIISHACRVLIPYIEREFPHQQFILAIDPAQIILITANKIDIPQIYINKSLKLYKILRKKGFEISGNNPKGIAIAILYIILKNQNYMITQSILAKNGSITEVTLRNIMKKIYAFMSNHSLSHLLSKN